MYEEVLTQLAIAQGCMERISNNLPLNEVVAKGKAMGKAIRLINQLNGTLDMERGGEIAAESALACTCTCSRRLTLANATNDAAIVGEVIGAGAQDQKRLGRHRDGRAMSRRRGCPEAVRLQRALELSQELRRRCRQRRCRARSCVSTPNGCGC